MTTRPELDDVRQEALRLSRELRAAQVAYKNRIQEAAEAERDFRKATSEAAVDPDIVGLPAAVDRKAAIDGQTADARYRRDLARGAKTSAVEAIENYRKQIGLLQSLMATERELDRIERYGQDGRP